MAKKIVIGAVSFIVLSLFGLLLPLGLFGLQSVSACSTMAGTVTGISLPQQTVEYLDSRSVKQRYQENIDRYMAAQDAEGVPAVVMAALHYREAGMNPQSSISNGAPLGSGVNVDGVTVVNDANEDAINMARHFKRMAEYVYGIDVVGTSMTAEMWGNAFLAYNRGFLYERAGRTYDQSPYVMNGIDDNHLNMSWIDADTVSGVDGNKAGALAVMVYLSKSETADDVQLSGLCSTGEMQAPVIAETLWVTSGFDYRVRSNGTARNHNGIDIIGGSDVVAAMGGTVTLAKYYGGYGYTVIVDHGNGISTLYGHLQAGSTVVVENQRVEPGQKLGTMGNTGNSEGVHLHFEYREGNVPINPFPVLEAHGIDLVWTSTAYPRNEKPGPHD